MIRLSFLFFIASIVFGAEGKWTPDQVLRIDPAWLKQQGLLLPPAKLWDPASGTGLLAATLSVGGCSGGFISPSGLFITNHHCLFSILQEHSTSARDLIADGFLARSPRDELRGKTTRATVPRRFTDVTREIRAAAGTADDLARYRAIEAKQKELVAKCEQQPDTRCQVAVYDGGVSYVLVEASEFADVRLVYAPPRWVGEYGGEIDNFMWPRHAGDFAIGRVYDAGGTPHKPRFWLPISKQGVKPGDFVMVMGYPGVTYRSLIADQVAERRDLYFTRRADLFGEWINILEESTKGDPSGRITVAATVKSLANSLKNAQGQLEGFRRGRLTEKHRAAEEAALKWASARPDFKAGVAALLELRAIVAAQRETWERDFLLAQLQSGRTAAARGFVWPLTIVRNAHERAKPDAEREEEFMKRNASRLRDRLERDQKSYFEPADVKMFASILRRAKALPAGQRIAAIGAIAEADVARLYAGTRVTRLAERIKMLDESPEQLRARKDPLLDLAFALEPEIQAAKDRDERAKGADSRLRPEWRKAVMARAGKTLAPDANGTLRVTFAQVKGYQPRDAVSYTPLSTLEGMLAKATGEEPFIVPDRVAAAARAADPRQPVDFLSDADTTGGNSGSPTVNARGELVGVNFDRVWENVANDFGYNPAIARNVNVDIRYLLWILRDVDKADALLKELGQ